MAVFLTNHNRGNNIVIFMLSKVMNGKKNENKINKTLLAYSLPRKIINK